MSRPNPCILSFSSQVVSGHVGNSAAQFAMQRLGFEVLAVPTIVLGHHKGHEREPHQWLIDAKTLAGLADDAEAAMGASTRAVLSGYGGSVGALIAIADHVRRLKAAHPELIYLCDPVLGDHGRLYVDPPVAEAIGRHLAAQADILTPNLFELGWLTGTAPQDINAAVSAARSLDIERVLVTSAPSDAPGEMVNLLVSRSETVLARTPRLDNPPHGTGDLIAALFLARILQGHDGGEALGLAAASVHDVLEMSTEISSDELALVAAQEALIAPKTRIICETRRG